MSVTVNHIINDAAETALYLFLKDAKAVGFHEAYDIVDPADEFYMQMLINHVIAFAPNATKRVLERMSTARRQRLHDDIAAYANAKIAYAKANPEVYDD